VRKIQALIIGASDLGTACALRLAHAGIQIVLIENDCPLDIYQSRSFSGAVFSGSKTIEGVTAGTIAKSIAGDNLAKNANVEEFITYTLKNREIPLVQASDSGYLKTFSIDYIIVTDETLYKNISIHLYDNSTSVGFDTDADSRKYIYTICNAIFYFGRVIYPHIGPAPLPEKRARHVMDSYEKIKSPIEGVFQSVKSVNDSIHEKEEIAKINEIPILSPVNGRISGILNSGVIVPAGAEFVEIDKSYSGIPGNVISKDSMCLAGAVLEAILYDQNLK